MRMIGDLYPLYRLVKNSPFKTSEQSQNRLRLLSDVQALREQGLSSSRFISSYLLNLYTCLTPYYGDGRIAPHCPHRLGDQDAALSRLKQGFESPWGHCIY